MTEPRIDFGKRRTERQPDAPAPKRSSHVALLVMGTLAVGGGAYAMMGHENCQPAPPIAHEPIPMGVISRSLLPSFRLDITTYYS